MEKWHLRALALLGHVPYGDTGQTLISSWTRPKKRKKHWKSLALDYGRLASTGGSELLDMIQQILEMKRENKNLKILIRSGRGPTNKDVENFLDTLINLGIEDSATKLRLQGLFPCPMTPHGQCHRTAQAHRIRTLIGISFQVIFRQTAECF